MAAPTRKTSNATLSKNRESVARLRGARLLRILVISIGVGALISAMAIELSRSQPEWLEEGWTQFRKLGESIETPSMPIVDWRIQCGPRIDPSEIQRVVLSLGDELWKLEIVELHDRLAQLAWAEKVAVRRIFPDRLDIAIEERTPVALTRQPQLSYLDEDGRIIAGASVDALGEYPMVQCWDESAGEMGEAVKLRRAAVAFLTQLDREGVLAMELVSEASIDATEIRVMTIGGMEIRTPVELLPTAASRLAKVFQWRRSGTNGPDSVLAIRLGIGGRAFVTASDGEESGRPPLKI